MLVSEIAVSGGAQASELSARVELGSGRSHVLRYCVQGFGPDALSSSGDPFLAALLAPAMALGEDLEIDAPLSPRLLAASDAIQDIYAAWGPGLERIRIAGSGADSAPAPGTGTGTGLSFSAGVDSFYSLLKGNGRITHLVLVHGFDIGLGDARRFGMVAERVKAAAVGSGTVPVPVSTNLRDIADPLVPWAEIYHGAALASVGLALGGLLRRLVIGSSWAYQNLRPWGSHPLLDPLWSTEGLETVHDGCEARRSDKVRAISRSQLALENLHVCWSHLSDELNCGRCEKCVATMAILARTGALENAVTFPPGFTPDRVRGLDVSEDGTRQVLGDMLADMRRSGEHGDLADAVGYALDPPASRRARHLARRRLRAARRSVGRMARRR